MIIKRTKDIKIFNSLNKIYHITEQISKVSREKNKKTRIKGSTIAKLLFAGMFYREKSINQIMEKTHKRKLYKKLFKVKVEYLKNKISPDFIKLCNPEWNEEITENEAFIKALKLADEFWNVYIKHSIAEVEAIKMITKNIKEANDCYLIYEKELPYRKAIKMIDNSKVKYIIFKSRREGYDVRAIIDSCKFKDEIINAKNIAESKIISGIEELIYVDNHGKLCCTKTLEGAIKLIKYNEN